jgi:hypothetical protein
MLIAPRILSAACEKCRLGVEAPSFSWAKKANKELGFSPGLSGLKRESFWSRFAGLKPRASTERRNDCN